MSCCLLEERQLAVITLYCSGDPKLAEELARTNLEAVRHRYGDRHGPFAGGFLDSQEEVDEYIRDSGRIAERGIAFSDSEAKAFIDSNLYQVADHERYPNIPVVSWIKEASKNG